TTNHAGFPCPLHFLLNQPVNIAKKCFLCSRSVPNLQQLQRVTNIEISFKQVRRRVIVGMKDGSHWLVHNFPPPVKNPLCNSKVLEHLHVLWKASRLPNALTNGR